MLAAALLMWIAESVSAVTLEDFGYRHMTIRGQESLGHRPLLVLLIDFAGAASFSAPASFFDKLAFGVEPYSLFGYLLENSKGRFFWSRAGQGVLGPIQLPASQRYNAVYAAIVASGITEPQATIQTDIKYVGNFVTAAMNSGFDFKQFDTNADNVVTEDELGLLAISNDGLDNGANRSTGYVKTPNSPVAVNLAMAVSALHHTGFPTIAHELTHSLGALDLYGVPFACRSQNLTLMSCTLGQGDVTSIITSYHLDPWHKMQLGWTEPRIASLRDGGVAVLPAAQSPQADAPVILYDPVRGVEEFFILEYRSKYVPSGPGYDKDNQSPIAVPGDGLAIWHVRQDGDKNPVLLAAPGTDSKDRAVVVDGAPDLVRGGTVLWGSAASTPPLKWFDGSELPVRIEVRPYARGDSTITVDWVVGSEIWIDFSYPRSAPQIGTFDAPFSTLGQGTASIPDGGLITIKAGATRDTISISKRMRIQAIGGPVTIGR